MRIGIFEVALSRRRVKLVWHRSPFLAKRIDDMTPDELRAELANIYREMSVENTPVLRTHGMYRRVFFEKGK